MSDQTSTGPAHRGRSATSLIALIVAAVLTIATVILLLQNTIHTKIDFIAWNLDIPLGLALLGAAVIGGAIAVSLGTVLRVRRALR
jgi:uncharacterized integral membrane protein